jgi:hypothetical protein
VPGTRGNIDRRQPFPRSGSTGKRRAIQPLGLGCLQGCSGTDAYQHNLARCHSARGVGDQQPLALDLRGQRQHRQDEYHAGHAG